MNNKNLIHNPLCGTLLKEPLFILEEHAAPLVAMLSADVREVSSDIKGQEQKATQANTQASTFTLNSDRFGNPLPKMELTKDGTAIIPLWGSIIKSAGNLGKWYGMADLDDFNSMVEEAASSPAVQRVILDIDSPGGFTTGVDEAAHSVMTLAKKKPVMSYTEGLMASAAYWIGAGSNVTLSTRSAMIGSIGAFLVLVDASKFYSDMGVKFEVFASGKFKGAGSGYAALNDEQKSYFQDRVNKNADQFKSFVSSRRTLISKDDMEGQVFFGSEASTRGFVHGLVNNFSEAYAKFLKM